MAESENLGVKQLAVSGWEGIRYLTGFDFSMFDGQAALLLSRETSKIFYPRTWWIRDPPRQRDIELIGYDLTIAPSQSKVDLARAMCPALVDHSKIGADFCKSTISLWHWLKEGIKSLSFIDVTPLLSGLRSIKSPDEIALIERAASLCERGVEIAKSQLRIGLTEASLGAVIDRTLREEGAAGFGFPTMIGSGANGADPVWIGSGKPIKRDEAVFVDIGPSVDGYLSDITRTFFVGNPSSRIRSMFEGVREALFECYDEAHPGMLACELDHTAREKLDRLGYGGLFIHPAGHGVGLTVSEEPFIAPWSKLSLKEGMVFTLEIGVYDQDSGGVRLEDTVRFSGSKLVPMTKYSYDPS